MSLQTRLAALITAVGADVKALQARTPTVLSRVTSFVDTSQPTNAVEWWNSGALLAKLVAMNPIISAVIVNETEVRLRVKSRDGTQTAERLLLSSLGVSDYNPTMSNLFPSPAYDGQEIAYMPDMSNAKSNGDVVWMMKYRASDNKWYFTGGADLYLPCDGTSNVDITSTGYVAFTGRPTYTAPRPGTYKVLFGHGSWATAQISLLVAPTVNGAAPSEQFDSVLAGFGVGSVDQYGVARQSKVTVATAGHVIDLRARVTSGTAKLRQPWMALTPIALNGI